MTRALARRVPTGVVLSGTLPDGTCWRVENVAVGAPLPFWFAHVRSGPRWGHGNTTGDAPTLSGALRFVREEANR